MRRRIIYAVFVLMLAALLGISGVTAGARLEAWRSRAYDEFQDVQSTAIALLSMDIGAEYQREQVVFAEDIIASLPATYTLVSKEVGEKGLAEGSYGALITFPADFSICLTTINSQRPITAQFTYKLNMNLPEDALLEVMTEILELEREVNDRLSYMFISSVFEEFHDAQRRVSVVLANDASDLQALSEVQSADLVAKLQLTMLPQEIPEFRAADISELTSDNQSIMADMDESYQEYLQLVVDDHTATANEIDKTLNDENDGVVSFKGILDELTWLPASEGEDNSFARIIAEASAAIAAVSEALTDPVLDVSDVLDEMERSELDTDDYEEERERIILAMLADQRDAILMGSDLQPLDNPVPPPIATPTPPPMPAPTDYPDDYNPYSDPYFRTMIESFASSTNVTVIEDALRMMKDNGRAQGISIGRAEGLYDGQIQGLSEGFALGESEGRAQGEYDGRKDANDHFMLHYATSGNPVDSENFYYDYDKTGMTDEFQALKDQYASNTNIFKDDLNDRVEAFNAEVAEGYEGFRDSLTELDEAITKTAEAEREATEAYEQEQKNSLNSSFDEKIEQIQEFSRMLTGYNPLQYIVDNSEVFTDYAQRFRDNVSGIQAEVSEQVTHDNEQLNKLYQDNAEYISRLKEDIQNAKDEGDEQLAAVLKAFYDAKMETSESNVENMTEFAGKLPNSHIGNLGNNNLYNFMASPILSVNGEPLARPALPEEISRVEILHGDVILYLIAAAAILMLLGLITLFSVSAISDYRVRKQYEDELKIYDNAIQET